MSLSNITCIYGCGIYSNQYLGLIMVIFGALTFVFCLAYILMADFLVFRHSRVFDVYLTNFS